MAHVIGPNRYLPGNVIPENHVGITCDECKEPAAATVVGETDSFGSELHHLCQTHYDEFKTAAEASALEDQYCDHCRSTAPDVRHMRDPDEGSCGPVYNLCKPHRDAMKRDPYEDYSDDSFFDRY